MRHRTVATISSLVALVMITTSCRSTRPATADLIRTNYSSTVTLELNDATTVEVRWPELDADLMVHGTYLTCSGPSCANLSDHFVALNDVRTITGPDPARTTAVVAATVTAVVVILTIGLVAAFQSVGGRNSGGGFGGGGGGTSCPRAYSWTGSEWVLDSGTFGGSLFASAPQTDHDMLDRLASDRGKLKIRLKNELPETEHIDAITLRVVDHPVGTHVVPTASGKLLTFRDPNPPVVAVDSRGLDALDTVATRDEREWTSNLSNRNPERTEDARDGLVLSFVKPKHATHAKLWINARNTDWASTMLTYLLSQLGPALPNWWIMMNHEQTARAGFGSFMDRAGALRVDVQTPTTWDPRGRFSVAGPEVLKDQAIEFPVDDVPSDRLTVRLEAPVGFWSIDSAAVAYDDDEPVETHDLSPISATTKDGADVRATLSTIDDKAYSTVMGDWAELTFDEPPQKKGFSRSFVLASTGYYVPDVTPDPHADPAFFARMTSDPDAASRQALAMLNAMLVRRLLR